MSLNAYQQATNQHESELDTEYRLFNEVTRSMVEVQKGDPRDPSFFKALDWNRRMWSTLSSDCAVEGNGLPKELRAGIISLGLWVSKFTSQVARGTEDIESLISINKTIMEGLADQRRNREAAQQKAIENAPKAPEPGTAPVGGLAGRNIEA